MKNCSIAAKSSCADICRRSVLAVHCNTEPDAAQKPTCLHYLTATATLRTVPQSEA